jgi:hypothetical protein
MRLLREPLMISASFDDPDLMSRAGLILNLLAVRVRFPGGYAIGGLS